MDDIVTLAKAIRAEKIERARQMTIPEKFRAGAELFEQACDVTRSGIRSLNPEWNPDEIEAELKRRLELRSRKDRSKVLTS